MRGFMTFILILCVMASAYWAYSENYRTQAAQKELAQVRQDLARAHARARVLEAEWAYLNRPDRLRDLASINYDSLGLVPMMPDSFGSIDVIAFPPLEAAPASLGPITNPIEVDSQERESP